MRYKNILSHKFGVLLGLIVTFLFCGSLSLNAQFTDINAGIAVVAFGDYDNDGTLDFLTSGSIIHNNGDGTFNDINAGFGGTAWGDYNNDGYLDVLSGSTVYRNNGDSTFTNINVGMISSGTDWGDFDNDGDQDILTWGAIYRNNGYGIFTNINANCGGSSWGDYDNDGDLDILSNNTVYRNNGDCTFTVTANVSGYAYSSSSWGDYDNDGDLDFILTGYYNSNLMSNNGDGTFSCVSGLYAAISNHPIGCDFDNDGDLDLLYTGFPYVSLFYRNDGYNVLTNINAWFPGLTDSYHSYGDYNNDGNIDISITGRVYEGYNISRIYRNDIDASNQPPTIPDISYSMIGGICLAAKNATDDTTPSIALNHNFRIGSTPGGYQIVSPMSLSNGHRNLCAYGNAFHGNYVLEYAPNTVVNIYASAQALDNSYTGSAFCDEVNVSTITPALNLSYPNGGESLVSGTTSFIKWDNNSVTCLNIKLTTDNGLVWTDLVALPVASAPGLYYYTVPIANSNQCKIKVLWAKDNSYYDESDQVFTVSSNTTEPTISLVYPTATGINMTPGQPVNITWTSSNVAAVSLDYTTNNGISWNSIIETRPAALSPYTWIVTDSLTNQARIRIRSTVNANYYDISDNTFTICKVSVLSPNGGEVLTGDFTGAAPVPINWTAPYVGTVDLSYSTNNGANWISIATVAAFSGTYNWVLPAIESSSCRVKVSHSSAPFISDISNAVFTIRVPVKFVNANGGGFVNNNCNYTLRWKNIDIPPATQVHLEYSTDNSTWTRVNTAAVPITNLSHTFYMALGEASQVWFRMAETGTNKIIAKSASAMTVTGKTLHVSTPAIGEGLAVDSYTTITWTADGCTNLDIFYTTDFGATWLPVATNVPSSQGYQVWLVPNTTSTQCRIKLQDTTYPYMNIESDGEFTILALTLIASFYGTPTSGYSDLTVQFYDQSIGYISAWAWDFENDGITDSNLQNPTWTYRQSGFYSVKLTVWDGPTSITMTRNNYIYVLPMIADFLASETNGFAPLTVQFTDMTPSDITQWAWDFDADGITDSDAQNPYWTYLFPGTYTVKLNVTNGLDSDDEIKLAYITVTLDPSLTLYVPTQYSTIQAAINASVDGDYIIISDGIYYENLLIEGKNITLASYYFIDGDSTHIANTIIDGSNAINPDQASTITILPASGRPITKPHIVGFTIRNGSGRRIIQNEGGSIIEKRVGGGIYMRQVNPIFSYNKIEDNDADDEGGGSYAFQSLPNHGGMVDPAIGVYNPGGNFFANNHADIGSDIYIEGVTQRDLINLQNCSFEVMSQDDTTVSNYWVNSSAGVNYSGSSGRQAAINSDIWVATNGSDTLNDGLSPASPFRTIDHALSRIYATEANPLTINIASGTYSPSLTGEKYPLQMVKYVCLQGAGREETILDAEGNADFPSRVLNLDKVEGIRISDLTLMNGFVTLAKNYNGGAVGILSSQASLNNLIVAGCSSAGNGAGLYALDSSVDADSLSFQYNSALGSGGAIHSEQSNLNLTNSDILDNSVTKNGAGLSLNGGEISISGCEISGNQATGFLSKGGGIILSGTEDALLKGNWISHNNADNGAGAYLQDNSGLHLDRNRFTNNLADISGGGLLVNTTEGLFTNNLIANNSANQRGGALYCYSSPQFINNTITSNKAGLQGGALYLNGASPSLTNCILWGNVHANPETPNQIYLYGEASDPDITYSDIRGGSTGFLTGPGASYSGVYANNIDSDPLFVEASIGAGYYFEVGQNGYSLLDGSPAIDSGDPITDIQFFPLDLEANPRLDNSRIDIGAWEAVHFIGARIVANPAVLDFGRVNISGTAIQQTIYISNTGNQPLLISELTLELPGTEFFWTFAELGTPIQPGASVNLQISFLPQQLGAVSNILSLVNNSLNNPILRIPLVGFGIDASTSQPGNVQLQIMGNDVTLSWDPVLSDPQGNPFTPEGYIVLYCETANASLDDFLFLSLCTATNFVHASVARFSDKMFYRVIAIGGLDQSSLRTLAGATLSTAPVTWAELKSMFMMKP